MRVLSVASEVYPLVKTGGLADVVGALPGALAPLGIDMHSLVPGYPEVLQGLTVAETVHAYSVFYGGTARILAGTAQGLNLFVLDAPHLYDRTGNPYLGPDGRDWPDNGLRFAALARAGADVSKGLVPSFAPDIAHAHDWQPGLLPAFLHYDGGAKPPCVVTVHNLAFQGQFPPGLLAQTGLPAAAFALDGVEYYGSIGYLKAALQFADRITTVSPSYALEMLQPEGGMGLEGLLQSRAGAVSGILNGIDTDVWNPATDPHLAAAYDAKSLAKRARNKAALQERLGLGRDPERLLFGVVSRLSWQKGLDLFATALPVLTAYGQLALLGAGDRVLEAQFAAAAVADPQNIGCVFQYDEALAHQIQAGVDVLLVPSRFEPCGLTQLCALRYGAVPMVSRVGGLNDTVIDANEAALAAKVATGFHIAPLNRVMIEAGIRRAAALYQDKPAWARLQRNGMAADISWRQPAARYAALYRGVLGVAA